MPCSRFPFFRKGQHDIVRADIPVHDPRCVYLFQRFQHRAQDGERFFLGELSAFLLQILLQADPLYVLHHDIGGIVFIKEILHRYDAGDVCELRNISGLIHIFFQPLLVGLALFAA